MCQQRGGVAWGSVTAQSDQRVAVDRDQWYTARVVTLLANDHPSLDHAGTVVMPARLIVFVMVMPLPLPMVMPIAMSAVATVVMALVVMTAVLAIGHGWSDKAQAKHKGQCQ